jgi:hypothetical protein
MIYPYIVNKINQNSFHRVFIKNVNIETYQSSWFEIIRKTDCSVNTLSVITDYTDCKLMIDNEEFSILANFLKYELRLFEKLRFAVVVNTEENNIKLEIWKTELILHGLYIHAKVCIDNKSAFDFIEIK